jgi:hypothetical protein
MPTREFVQQVICHDRVPLLLRHGVLQHCLAAYGSFCHGFEDKIVSMGSKAAVDTVSDFPSGL